MKAAHIAKTITTSIFVFFLLVGCKTTSEQTTQNTDLGALNISQQNVDATLWTSTSAEMHYASIQAFDFGLYKLRAKLVADKNNTKPLAVVMDLDETVLDNSPYMLDRIAKGKTYDRESWGLWCAEARAKALPGALEFIKKCNTLNITVIYISNRSISTLDYTYENLLNLGLKTEIKHVLLKENESDKTERRNAVTAQFNVLLYLGDNLRDFSEYFTDRQVNYGKDVVDEEINNLRENFVIIPNPMYGEWKKPFYGGASGLTNSEKLDFINSFIKTQK